MYTIGYTDRTTSGTAIALCLTSPIIWSMTPLQRQVFRNMARQQLLDGGVHSLLPNVMDAFRDLACRPWWDAGVADLVDEPDPRKPDPPTKPLVQPELERWNSAEAHAMHWFAGQTGRNPTTELAMTRAQQWIVVLLCDRQMEAHGATSLLPNVVDAFRALALSPWWDRRVADIPYESDMDSASESGLPA